MSLGAAALTNNGALLLVDSMGLSINGGNIFQRPDSRKALRFPSVDGVGFVSGSHDYARLKPTLYERQETDLESLSTNLYGDLFDIHGMIAQRVPSVANDGLPHLLVVRATGL